MGENLQDHRGIFDGGGDGQRPAALGAGGEIDGKEACESLRPTHAGSRGGRGAIAVCIDNVQRLVGLTGHDLGPQRGVGRQHAMEANEMKPGTGDEGHQALEEFQRGHDEMGGAIPVRGFELKHDRAGRGAAQPFVAQSRARDVTAQPFECLSLLGATRCVGMQAKPLGTDTALGVRHLWAGEAHRQVFPGQHFLPCSV